MGNIQDDQKGKPNEQFHTIQGVYYGEKVLKRYGTELRLSITNTRPLAEIEEERQVLFETCKELVEERRIENTRIGLKHCSLIITLDDQNTFSGKGGNRRLSTIGHASINFGPEKSEPMDKLIRTIHYESCLKVDLDKSAKAMVIGNTTTPMRDHFELELMTRLEHLILSQLYEQLRSKEPDLFDFSKAQLKADTDTVAEEAAEVLKQPESKPVYAPEKISTEPAQVAPAARTQITLKELTGFSCDRICRAFSTLLGKPIRTKGSHTIFRSRPEGKTKTYPFYNHQRKDVGVGHLGACLENYGITPDELADALR